MNSSHCNYVNGNINYDNIKNYVSSRCCDLKGIFCRNRTLKLVGTVPKPLFEDANSCRHKVTKTSTEVPMHFQRGNT